MRSLRELYLDGVNISSQSSEWCETTSLSLPKLSVLSMSNCDLNGHFPAEFFLLPKMQRIDISDNSRLMGQLPEFPINNTLEVLSLQYTNFSGKLPESISNLKLLRVLTLSKLSLNFNSISGSIPPSIANLSNLVELDLSGNNFNGLIPPFHRSGVPNLAYLDLSRNRLSGSVPSSLFTLSTLQTLSLGYNSFSDYQLKLDMFFQLNNLRFLDLSNMSLLIGSHNKSLTFPQLEGLALSIPDFGGATQLYALKLKDNKLEGKLPRSLANCTMLYAVNLGNNTLHDTFPLWLGKLPGLMSLRGMMVIDGNKVKPSYVGDNYYYKDSVTIMNRGFEIFYQKILTLLTCLDLSNNNFHGRILEENWNQNEEDLSDSIETEVPTLFARMLFFCGYGDLPSFVMPWWFGNQVMAQLKPWKEKASRNRGVKEKNTTMTPKAYLQ
ncbi:hypothetical protein GOBAR_DD29298 [Gossypium barbadense]|nr:hypothetical protein GOBAR_DD29298 [Gossypium barbadense]